MTRDGFLMGEVEAKSGVSRKALRLYETAGIVPPPRRTASGYRTYGPETLAILAFVARARRLGFHLNEIKEVVGMRRSGRCPCPHVLELVRRKIEDLDRTLADLTDVRRGLHELLKASSRSPRRGEAPRCHHTARLTLITRW